MIEETPESALLNPTALDMASEIPTSPQADSVDEVLDMDGRVMDDVTDSHQETSLPVIDTSEVGTRTVRYYTHHSTVLVCSLSYFDQ